METDKGAYKLGYRFIEFANIVRMDHSLSTIALPYMKALTQDLGETTILSVISDLSAVCVETVPSLQPIKVSSEQGKIVPIYAGASSKAILAFQSEALIDQLFSRKLVKKFTEKTLATKEELIENLDDIREKGYAISDSEIDVGVFSYGFPIRDSKQTVFASLTVSGPTDRMLQKSETEIIEKCQQAVREIEKFL
ncbi:IclR family transcriptional regulator [Bacillus oleivorans]|uniref:IclR family transcriptional regulator n=2 Tax=Bacillus oleivorans TaxID=1448271 RepID=A0A285D4G4_9BACI|nr:IclR family transcriptional regulator [Bacillus oleivorans]